MNNKKCRRYMKMKRIALISLSVMYIFAACTNESRLIPDDPDEPPVTPVGTKSKVSLKIHVPSSGVQTYAGETPASTDENRIDTLFIYLYQGSLIASDTIALKPSPDTRITQLTSQAEKTIR